MSKKVVLLISSDPRFFERRENAFQARGCNVFTAMDGTQATAFLADHGADLVISLGAPEGVDAATIRNAVGDDNRLVIVANKGHDVDDYRAASDVHIVETGDESVTLLKLSSKLLSAPARKYVAILVQVRVTQPKPTTIFARSRNLSDSGIGVEVNNQALTVHDQVTVSFLIPGADRQIQAEGLVTREMLKDDGKRRYGIQFLSLGDYEREMIENFIADSST
ncbi:MAG: hypothetical protein ACI9OJ_000815 [Myxococcota bacterium]|jgi:hypothetical protein